MCQRFLSLMLVGTLFSMTMFVSPIFAVTQTDKEAQLTAKVKAGVAKLGTGEGARISVKLRNQTKVKGYVSQAGEDSFVVTDRKTNQATTVAYSDVAQVKGKGLSTGVKIAIGVGIGLGAMVAIVAIAFRDFDPLGRVF